MEYFHYVNIFETKGLEYILVILFMITFVFFVRNLRQPAPRHPHGEHTDPGKTIVVVKDGKGPREH